MKKIAVFASGSGTNFQAMVDAVKKKHLHAEIVLVVCDKPKAYVIHRATCENINTFVFNPKDYSNKESYEDAIVKVLKKYGVEFIALAGYMRIIGQGLLNDYKDRIINIHPSLLPVFKGKDAIKRAVDDGASRIGVTVHWVDEGIDTGQIIAQESFEISGKESMEEIEKKVHRIEHRLYPEVLNQILKNNI